MALEPLPLNQVKGKTVALRPDINSAVVDGRPLESPRISAHAKTLVSISSAGAKTVVLAHQGRKGQEDFVSLSGHASLLESLSGKKIEFIAKEKELFERIPSLNCGEILLFENMRFFEWEENEKSPEEHSKNPFIQRLASLTDFFALDGFSVAHRSHASVVGLIPLLPSFMGPVFDSEFSSLSGLYSSEGTRLLILGGAKPKDSLKVLKNILEKNSAAKVLLGGLFAELFLKAQGFSLGAKEKFFEEKGFNEFVGPAKKLLDSFASKLELPVDLAFEANNERRECRVEDLPGNYMVKDIGSLTASKFEKFVSQADFIFWNGPLGVFEEKNFSFGTKTVAEAVSSSKAFSLIGGGDTATSLEKLGFAFSDFSYVSLSGKAALKFIAGETLPALEALREAKNA